MQVKDTIIKNERIIGLDTVRAIAILAVVMCHSSEFLNRLTSAPYIGNGISRYIKFVQPFGQLGVELFFVLSGFLIGGILIRAYMSSGTFTFTDVRHFWIRRWFRTLPNFWLILTINIILYKIMKFGGFEPYKFLYYFFLQNLWTPHPPFFFGEAWSLSVEEWFYLTVPVFMLIAAAIAKPVNKQKFLFNTFLSYLLVFLSVRVINAFHPLNGPDQDAGIRKVVLFRLDAVMYGVIFAYFSYFKGELLHRLKNYLLLASIAGTVFIYYIITDTGLNVFASSNPTLRFASDAFLYLLIPFVFALCLPYAASTGTRHHNILTRFIQHISKISYSMYLVHYSLVFIPFFCFLKVDGHTTTVLLYILYWAIVIVLSSLLYKYFEYPVMKLRDRFS